jgi:O-antigen/teichoic acid export membrane protein
MKLLKLVKFLRFKPFDVATAEGRSQERYRLALWSFMANIVSKIMAFAVIMLSIRWTLPYLGEERFGVWMTVTSFTAMLVLLDFGIGSALINHAAHTAAEDDTEKLKETISGSLGFLFLVSCVMGIFLCFLAIYLPIQHLIKVKDATLLPEIRQTLLVFAALFGFNLFGTGVQKLFAGLQRNFESLLASAICSLMALIGVWWASHLHASIPVLLAVTLGIQSMSGILLLLLLLKRKLFVFHRIFLLIAQQYKQLIKPGFHFFILQISLLFSWSADSLIISSTLGAANVATYSIAQKLFQICTMTIFMFNGPLWGAYADANAREDKVFIKTTFFRSIKLIFILVILILTFLLIFNKTILNIWLSNTISIPFAFLLAFAIWTLFECVAQTMAVFLNGVHIVKPQIVKAIIIISLALPLKFWLIHDYGVISVPIISASVYFIAMTFVYGFLYREAIKKRLY